MFDLDEYAKKLNQEALDRTANELTKKLNKELEENGVCFIEDLYSGTIFESFSNDDYLHGFTNDKGQV